MTRSIAALLAPILLAMLVACGSIPKSEEFWAAHEKDPLQTMRWAKQADENVRITANPEAVRECKFLGNVKSVGHATRSTWDLQWKTARLGGNTLFTVNPKPGREIFGDAYSCETRR